jgi:hypothetical protein
MPPKKAAQDFYPPYQSMVRYNRNWFLIAERLENPLGALKFKDYPAIFYNLYIN